MPNIIIAGSRNMDDYHLMKNRWADYAKKHGLTAGRVTIISGGANGADKLAERLAKENGLHCKVMRADWQANGKSAGHIRNAEMVKAVGADGHLLAFWDGQSPGTAGTIKQARHAGLHVEIVRTAEDEAEQLTLFCSTGYIL